MPRKITTVLATLLVALGAHAQNPIIRNQFTADPTARVFNDRIYLYPSHDIPSPVERLKTWFCMADYHVFSSDDLTEWTDHGVIVDQNNVPWVQPDSYSMWAPDCVEKNGRYYFYFPSTPRGEGRRGFGVGVAIANQPTGPFRPMRQPIEGISGIDPCVLQASDGHAYIYWSGRGIQVARLDDNMTRLADSARTVAGLPDGFKEGPFAFERDGKYYLTFPWVRKNTETLAYAMADNPYGPFTFKGLIMEESPTGCWTNHHSIVQFKEQWYLFYHHNDFSPKFDKLRSARIDSLTFNADGTIRLVRPTLRGVGITPARSRIQIDRYSDIDPRTTAVSFLSPDSTRRFEGWKAELQRKNARIRYNSVDFGQAPVGDVTVRVRAPRGGRLAILTCDGAEQTLATLRLPRADVWTCVRTSLKTSPQGIHDIGLRLLSNDAVEVDWVGFGTMPLTQGAFTTGEYRNYFAELGHAPADIDRKVEQAFNDLFFGPRGVYTSVGDSMGYVSDIKNHDVRTEGMSYGMMVAVQLDRKDIFDRLWRWARKYMQHQQGDLEGYFAWSCRTDGTRNSEGAASDGELYFVTSLIFASNRWGDQTGIDYKAEARRILDCSMMKAGKDNTSPFINLAQQLITFTPGGFGDTFTDPSYHVPAFYEVWSRWAGDGRSRFWMECARKSREYLHKAVHPTTGLTPDYSNYDGTLRGSLGIIGDAFRFDSWRVPMNIALDYAWSCADRDWQRDYADRIQSFLYAEGIDTFVDQYNVDGSRPQRILDAGGYTALRHSLGLVSTAAAISLAATHSRSREFAERLWNATHEPYADGYFDAYYDGFLRLFALMHLSGRYRIIEPQR